MITKSSLKVFWFGLLLSTLNPQPSTLFAQVPSVISYQGRVQAGGTNFSGTGQFKFALVSPGTNVSRQATAAAAVTSGFVTAINVIDGGGGYPSAPAVIITDPTGSRAAAVAQVSGGVITSILVQNAGSGYSAAPSVSIAPPPLTIVHGTFWSNDGTSSGGSEPASAVAVPVQQGLFTVFLGDSNLPNMQPVPADVFAQAGVHLRIWFSDGTNGFAQLAPDQRVGSVGYALMAAVVSEGGVSGAALATGSVTSAKIENGSILVEDLSSSLLNDAFWNLSGNSGTTPSTRFLGTTDNQPLEFRVNGARALRLEPRLDLPDRRGIVNVIGGSPANSVASDIYGATIAGGGAEYYEGVYNTNRVTGIFGTVGGGGGNTSSEYATVSGGSRNTSSGGFAMVGGGVANIASGAFTTVGGGGLNKSGATYGTIAGGRINDIGVNSDFSAIGGGGDNNIATGSSGSTIAGGEGNDIGANSEDSAIGGGSGNDIGANSDSSTIGGGNNNLIAADSISSTIAGGSFNSVGRGSQQSIVAGGAYSTISSNSTHSAIGGGGGNRIAANSSYSVIAGGIGNDIAANSLYATIPGGEGNSATTLGFAAGRKAQANHQGAFVWGDSTTVIIASTNANSVTFRAAGGYRLFSNSGASQGVYLAPSGGSWTSISDRNAKENFDPVNARAVLDKVAALPLSTWNYKSQTNGVRHIGPMAQDFKAAFGVGETDTGITTVDADGVALAAIQGLNLKLEEKSAEMQSLKEELAGIKQALQKITQQRE